MIILNKIHDISGVQNEQVVILLVEYKAVFPEDLSLELSSSKSVDHKIEIIVRSVLLSKLTYRLS